MDDVAISDARPEPLERVFRRRLALVLGACLVVLAGGLLADFAVTRHGAAAVEARSHLAALVAEQSLVVHRLALVATEIREGDASAPGRHRTRTAALAEELDRIRRIIADGDAGSRLPPAPEWAAAILFSGPHHLDRRLAELADAARELAGARAGAADRAAEVIEYSRQVGTGLDFLGRLAGDAVSEARATRAQVALALRLMLLGALGGLGLRVLRPLVGELCQRIRELAAARDAALDAARRDPLTGFVTRDELVVRLGRLLGDRASTGQFLGIVKIGFARFEAETDPLGGGAAGAVLHETARRLRAERGSEDIVARSDGHGFILVLADLLDEGELADACGRLLDALSEPVRVGQAELSPGPFIGAASAIGGSALAETALAEARIAFAAARRRGAGAAEILTPELRERYERRRNWLLGQAEAATRLALLPIVSLASGGIEGVMASASAAVPEPTRARGGTAESGFRELSADAFGPALRRSALAVFARWQKMELAPRLLLVPVSVAQLRRAGAADALLFELDGAGLSAPDITFLISAGPEDMWPDRVVAATLSRLAAAGSRLGLDLAAGDSLPRLAGAAGDALRCLRLRSGGGERERRAFAAFAQAAGLDLIGGALATEAEVDAARAAGFGLGDGPNLGRPMEEEELTQRIASTAAAPTAAGGSGRGALAKKRDAG